MQSRVNPNTIHFYFTVSTGPCKTPLRPRIQIQFSTGKPFPLGHLCKSILLSALSGRFWMDMNKQLSQLFPEALGWVSSHTPTPSTVKSGAVCPQAVSYPFTNSRKTILSVIVSKDQVLFLFSSRYAKLKYSIECLIQIQCCNVVRPVFVLTTSLFARKCSRKNLGEKEPTRSKKANPRFQRQFSFPACRGRLVASGSMDLGLEQFLGQLCSQVTTS